MFYADDLVLLAESREILIEMIKIWKEGLESKGLRVNIGKTKVVKCHVVKYAGLASIRVEYVERVWSGSNAGV